MRVLTTFTFAAVVVFGAVGIAQSASDTNMEILMQKVKADKKLLVASNMGLTDEEGSKFWPLYEEYQKELDEMNRSLGCCAVTRPVFSGKPRLAGGRTHPRGLCSAKR